MKNENAVLAPAPDKTGRCNTAGYGLKPAFILVFYKNIQFRLVLSGLFNDNAHPLASTAEA